VTKAELVQDALCVHSDSGGITADCGADLAGDRDREYLTWEDITCVACIRTRYHQNLFGVPSDLKNRARALGVI
jgi:hypothetical protein